MEIKYTKTPWQLLENNGVSHFVATEGFDEDNSTWGEIICQTRDSARSKENAAHIVKCVNMHDQLVALIVKMSDLIEANHGWNTTGISQQDVDQALKSAGEI